MNMQSLLPNVLFFLTASVAITVAPGPDNMQVLARGISQGRAAGVVAALGFSSGVVFHTLLAAFCIAALLRSSPVAFEAAKLAGAVYLIWIGIKALRGNDLTAAHTRPAQPLPSIYRQSVLGNMMSPKVSLFFIVFLPQFVDTHSTTAPVLQMLMFGGLFMAQACVVLSAFGLGSGMIGDWLRRRPRVGVWLDRLAGLTFIGLGLRIAFRD